MKCNLNLCYDARMKYNKDDFLCDVWTYRNKLGNLNCWALVQDLTYRYKDFSELSIWTPKAKRGQGYATELMEEMSDYYINEDKILSVWVNESNKSFFKKVAVYGTPFWCFDMEIYKDTGAYAKW